MALNMWNMAWMRTWHIAVAGVAVDVALTVVVAAAVAKSASIVLVALNAVLLCDLLILAALPKTDSFAVLTMSKMMI